MNNRRKWFLFFCFCAAVLWMFFIFSNSMENMQISGGKSTALLKFLERDLDLDFDTFKKHHQILRKLAHFGEFFLLELLLFSLLKEKKQAAAMSFFLCVTVAFLDEGLQMLSDRHADLRDVILDSCGALSAMLLWLLFAKIRAHFRKRKNTAR